MSTEKYQGWKNYATWNVILWIGNDEELYELAKNCYHEYSNSEPYKSFVEAVKNVSWLSYKSKFYTPDGIAWSDPTIDLDAVNKYIGDL